MRRTKWKEPTGNYRPSLDAASRRRQCLCTSVANELRKNPCIQFSQPKRWTDVAWWWSSVKQEDNKTGVGGFLLVAKAL
jgi:hypothetical protein